MNLRHSAAAALAATGLTACLPSAPVIDSTRALARAAQSPLVTEVMWRVDVGSARDLEEPSPQTGGLALNADGTTLYAGLANGQLVAFDAATGDQVWAVEFGGAFVGAPTFAGGVVYAAGADGTVRALDARGGSELWRASANAVFGVAPTVWGDFVYVSGSDATLYAFDRWTGEARWDFSRPPAGGIELIGQGGVYVDALRVCAGFSDGSLACVGHDGAPQWVADLTHGARRLTDVDSTPVLAGELLVASSYSGGVTAVNATSGIEAWTLDLSGAATVELRGDVLLVATGDGEVVWVDSAEGAVLRTLALDAGGLTAMSVANDVIAVGAGRGGLFWLDANVPWILNQLDPASGLSAAPLQFGDATYALTDGGYLYRVRIARR